MKLAYAIPWLHHSGGTVCEPVDVPVSKRHLDMVTAHLRLSDSPSWARRRPRSAPRNLDRHGEVVFGLDFVDQHCVVIGNINANSPLVFDGTMTKALRAYARANNARSSCRSFSAARSVR